MGNKTKQTFLKRRHTKWPTSTWKMLDVTNHQDIKIKTIMSYHPLQWEWVLLKRQRGQVLGRTWREGNAHILLGGCKLVQPLWKTGWGFLKKLKVKIHDPTIHLLGIYPKEGKSAYGRDICTSVFITALSTIAKIWNQLQRPWMMNG
jgi:hypothetical protein